MKFSQFKLKAVKLLKNCLSAELTRAQAHSKKKKKNKKKNNLKKGVFRFSIVLTVGSQQVLLNPLFPPSK